MLIMKADSANAVNVFKKAALSHDPVIFPTDTIYGIGAGFFDKSANEKIYKIKGRREDKPFPVLISDIKQLEELEVVLPENMKKILKKFWPGAFTFIMDTELKDYPYAVKNGKIAVRLPDKKWLTDAIGKIAAPLTATSANLSGRCYTGEFEGIFEAFKKEVSYFLYNVHSDLEKRSSTIVDISGDSIDILRNPLSMDVKNFQ